MDNKIRGGCGPLYDQHGALYVRRAGFNSDLSLEPKQDNGDVLQNVNRAIDSFATEWQRRGAGHDQQPYAAGPKPIHTEGPVPPPVERVLRPAPTPTPPEKVKSNG